MIELGFEFQAMACPCELRLLGADEAVLRHAAAVAMGEVHRIQAKYSRYEPGSVVSDINASAGLGRPIQVDAETASLLDFAASLHALSDGRFDITAGVLRRAWGFRRGTLPSSELLHTLRRLIGWSQVRWADGGIELPLPGMELDFGGFGKEYAADRAAVLLAQGGVRGGYVNLGGDVRVIGPRAGGAPWRFGIQHPRHRHVLLGEIELLEGGLATSGDYERYFEVDGQRYSHLLDPRSAWPVQHWQSVSVVAPSCAAAGALSTIGALMGADGLAFLDRQGVRYLAADGDGRLHSGGDWA